MAHELIYTAAGKPLAYEELSIPHFVQGHLIVMRGKKETITAKMASHLEELMGDSELYGWERVRAYDGVWLNQLQQGQESWQNEENIRYQHALIWHPATQLHQHPPRLWH